MTGQALAAAAERLIGSRFLLHGRDPATGLDCVGVVAAALAAIGRSARFPNTYTLRTRPSRDVSGVAAACGMLAGDAPILPGDVALVRVGACQLHVLVALAPDGFVHAHAGLRRVVRLCGPLEKPLVGLWRLPDTK